MAASADKIQLNLEKLLQDSLPLVKKGIFTQQEMKKIMSKREKHERDILKNTHHLVDFLAAIQYEYELERLRKAKLQQIKNSSQTYNPAFLKQGKTDFVIVKRIIQLWDRTMRQFRYRLDLWKQYLSFCITIKSRRHFYKALTHALSFLSFVEDLWKIGIQYEVEINCNMWKARRLYHKAIRANSKNFDMWKGYVEFELQFGKLLAERQNVLVGNTNEQELKFIMGGNEEEQAGEEEQEILEQEQGLKNISSVQVENHDEIIWLVIEECLQKARKNQLTKGQATTIQQAYRMFKQLIEQKMQEKVSKKNEIVGKMLIKLLDRLKNYKCPVTLDELQIEDVPNNQQDINLPNSVEKMELEELINTKLPLDKQQQYKHYMKCLELFQNLDNQERKWSILKQAIQKLVLKPTLLKNIISLSSQIDFFAVMDILVTSLNNSIKLTSEPLQPLLIAYVKFYNNNEKEQNKAYTQYLDKCIKTISDEFYVVNHKLLKAVIQYYSLSHRSKQLTVLHRKLAISCRKSPETVQLCSTLIRNCN